MSKIKKLGIIMVFAVIVILGLYTQSNAYSVGDKININYNKYLNDDSIYCMEHHQALNKTGKTYEIISNVKIEGNKSTDHKGKTIESWYNSKMVSILTADNGESKQDGPVQNAIWNFGYTWIKQVGQYHNGLYLGFANSQKGITTSLDEISTNEANNNSIEFKDNTNKEKIKVIPYTKNEEKYLRVGPFNWTISNKLTTITVYDQNGKSIDGILYSEYVGKTEVWFTPNGIISGKDFYISIPVNQEVTKITKITATMQKEEKAVNIWFLEPIAASAYQNLIIIDPYTTTKEIETTFDYNIELLGDLSIEKIDKDNSNIKLQNVSFIIKNEELNKYLNSNNGKITYVKKEKATEFTTDANGKIKIENMLLGNYVIYETKNENEGYESASLENPKEVAKVELNKSGTYEIKIKNERKYINLSGYVWVDKVAEKTSIRNDLFKENSNEYDDILLDGITVRLKNKTTGEIIQQTTTSNLGRYKDSGNNGHGEYLFKKVLIKELENYYIEFEYDGLTYTNVAPHIEKNNGSKAQENVTVRENFNKNFSIVEGKASDTGFTRDGNGNIVHSLSYNVDKKSHKATLINNGQYLITSNTSEAKYDIAKNYTGQEEIRYINLGLYEREQPDLALIKDIENVRLTVNGYEHTYLYAQRNVNAGQYETGFNVGVKFGNEYGKLKYSRPVYKADYEYINNNDKSKELKAYITYKIAINNQSTNLTAKINSIVDYYDQNYIIVKAGTSLDAKGDINQTINLEKSENYNDTYVKTVIKTNTEIKPQSVEVIYVQFELNREAVLNILNNGENLENVAEINSYSVFDKNGKVYAGVDKDSNPGNAVPGDITTYEDDTDIAPGLKLEVADAREITGKVFLDNTSGELMIGQIRQGSGIYEDGEKGIQGVEIELVETSGTGNIYKATTDENGEFHISGFIPGDYTLTYIWGDETYTVENYKGTIYNEASRQENTKWYKETSPRYSDAIDNYQTRIQIDNKEINVDKMNSTTPKMEIGIEYETTYTASTGDKYTYEIKNIDFGIVERARQDVKLEKRVKTMKLTLANGQIISNIEIDEQGNITGEKKYITYMGPSANTIPENGFVKIELDNELIQGATIEVTYEIKATNISELDYLSEKFYKYGIIEGEKVKIEVTGIVDYLDNKWTYEQSSTWQVKELEEIKNLINEEVYNSQTIKERVILYTEALSGEKLEPTQSKSIELSTSKVLSNNEEINLNNEVEILKLNKDGGAETISTPGNYIPGTEITENDEAMAEEVMVTPNTGDNLEFIQPITIGLTICILLGTGIIIIKKKVLKK